MLSNLPSRLLCIVEHMLFAHGEIGQGKAVNSIGLNISTENGPDILPEHHEQNMNRSISLCVDTGSNIRSSTQALLFNILSCPPPGTLKATLRWWVPALHSSMVPSAIVNLSKTGITGLFVENRRQDSDYSVLFVLPVIQSFMQQHGRIRKEIPQNIRLFYCQYIQDHVYRQNNPGFSKLKLFGSPTTRKLTNFIMPFFLVLVTVNWNGSAANLCGIAMVDAARLTFENTVLRQFPWPVMSKNRRPLFRTIICMLRV